MADTVIADNRHFVSTIHTHGYGKVELCDEITEVDSISSENFTHSDLVAYFASRLRLKLVVMRRKEGPKLQLDGNQVVDSATSRVYELVEAQSSMGADSENAAKSMHVVLTRETADASFGFDFGSTAESEHVVSSVSDGPAADTLIPGDKLLAVNSEPVVGLGHDRVVSMLTTGRTVELDILRHLQNNGELVETKLRQDGSGRLSTEYRRKDGSLTQHQLVVHQESVGWLSGSNIDMSEELNEPELESTDLLISLERGDSGFGFRIVGPTAEGRRHGVFVQAVKGLPALGTAMKVGHQVLRIRGANSNDWIDLVSATQADAGHALRNSGNHVELVLKENLQGFQKYAKENQASAVADPETQRNMSIESGLNFFMKKSSGTSSTKYL